MTISANLRSPVAAHAYWQPFQTQPPKRLSQCRSSWRSLPIRQNNRISTSAAQPGQHAASTTGTSIEAAPLVTAVGSKPSNNNNRSPTPSGPNPLKLLYKRSLRWLSDLPRAIYLMMSVASLSGLGTIIDQNKALDFYIENYPEGPNAVLGFLSWKVLLALELDHIYSAWYFLGLIALLGASLAACTSTRQLPIAKVAQRWRFAPTPQSMVSLGKAEMLPSARITDFGQLLDDKGYQVFLQEGQLYAFKGMAGRLGPIGVHAAMLLILAGTSMGSVAGFKGNVMCPEGEQFLVGDALVPVGALSLNPSGARGTIKVNSFEIDYRPDGSVAQFYSDLSVSDSQGREVDRKRISVNQPLRYGGVTMYQTDWSVAGLNVKIINGAAQALVGLPVTDLGEKDNGNSKLFATYLPLEQPTEQNPTPRGISFLARDLQTVALYDSKGEFAGVRRPGSNKPITVDGIELIVDSMVGATGLELKSDPGVPVVYAGFAGLMITVIVSYYSHSQIWALQQEANLFVAGRTNRGVYLFNKELDEMLDQVPELPTASSGS